MDKYNSLLKILIVGRVAWTKDESTLRSIFCDYPAESLAYICIETRDPDYFRCHKHFQISEVAMIRRLFNKTIKTGSVVAINNKEIDKNNEQKEKSILARVRSHRSIFYLLLREILWRIGNWKSKELDSFIDDYNPDLIFCMGDPLPLMNRLQRYVIQRSGKPGVIFLMDDIWSYTSCHNIAQYYYRFLLRKQVMPLVKACKGHFAISRKMKEEYDNVFGIDCEILTKGVVPLTNYDNFERLNTPITLIYTGNLLYGRYKSLVSVVNTIRSINNQEGYTKAFLKIYTQTSLKKEEWDELNEKGVSEVLKPVPYNDLNRIYNTADILLFVESLDRRYKDIARLSFSTKLTDYMGSGKCIFAVGDSQIAPIEFLNDSKIAVVCTNNDDININLTKLLNNPKEILLLAKKSYAYGCEYHGVSVMKERLRQMIAYACNNR